MNPIGMAPVQIDKHKINIQTLMAHIQRWPDHNINMSTWVALNRTEETFAEAVNPDCGTVCCIAGSTYLVKNFLVNPSNFAVSGRYKNLSFGNGPDDDESHKFYSLAKWLGLTYEQGVRLFYGYWHTKNIHGTDDFDSYTALNFKAVSKQDVLNELQYVLETGLV